MQILHKHHDGPLPRDITQYAQYGIEQLQLSQVLSVPGRIQRAGDRVIPVDPVTHINSVAHVRTRTALHHRLPVLELWQYTSQRSVTPDDLRHLAISAAGKHAQRFDER